MKTSRLILGISLLSFCCMVTIVAVASAAERSYPMVCRGGGAMQARHVKKAMGTGLNIPGLVIRFTKSRSAGTSSPPGPGECAWMDRPIQGDEPSVLQLAPLPYSKEIAYDVVIQNRSIGLELSEEVGRRSGFGYLVTAIQRGDLFYLHCYQKRGRGPNYFFITRTGP